MGVERQKEIIEEVRNAISNDSDFKPPKMSFGRLKIFTILLDCALFIVLMVLYLTKASSGYVLYIFISIYVVTFVLLLWDVPRALMGLCRPDKFLLSNTYSRLRGGGNVVTSLQADNISDLRNARDHVEFEMQSLCFRSSLIDGSMGKLGIIPAVFLIYYSYYLKALDSLPEKTAVSILVLVVSFYLLSVIVAAVAEKLRLIVYLLDKSIERKKYDTEQNNGAVT